MRGLEFIYPFGYNTQRIDIQTRIGLIQYRQTGLQHRHLEDLVFLLLAAGESFVHRAVIEFIRQLEHLFLLTHQRQKLFRTQRFFAFIRTLGIDRCTHEIGHTHAGYLYRILKTKEYARACAHFGCHLQEVLAFQVHLTARHFIGRITGQHRTQRTLARSVRTHDSMHLAFVDHEVHALQYLFAAYRGMQIFYFK